MFNPTGMSFTARKSDRKQERYPMDKLVKVERYLEGGRMLVRTERNKLMVASISAEAIARCRASEQKFTPPFFGHLIDERMKKAIPVGHKVILEKCEVVGNETFGDEKAMVVVSSRVINATDDDASKVFEGIFTLTRIENKIAFIQAWEDVAFVVDSDKHELFAKTLDEIVDSEARGEHPTRMGFMLRAVDFTGVMIESSFAIDRKEVEGKRVPLSGSDYKGVCEQYKAYLSEKYGASGLTIEAMTYKSYLCSGYSKHFDAPDNSILAKIADKGIILCNGDAPTTGQGKSWAVGGIIQLTSDAIDKKSKSFVPRNLATRVFYAAPRGDVRRFVARPDGSKVEIPDFLRPKKED